MSHFDREPLDMARLYEVESANVKLVEAFLASWHDPPASTCPSSPRTACSAATIWTPTPKNAAELHEYFKSVVTRDGPGRGGHPQDLRHRPAGGHVAQRYGEVARPQGPHFRSRQPLHRQARQDRRMDRPRLFLARSRWGWRLDRSAGRFNPRAAGCPADARKCSRAPARRRGPLRPGPVRCAGWPRP